ncbi:mannose-6-phosphate isomerase, class I [Microbacterium sp. MPKO10]|uniref:mannose-6-phosphate isomerase, class I n=1 Tax=Microbacterium sp. MPKO10 TaxID=2989818 RepID=UPI002236488E|nr:mannose-6-phosphate isomerase, class I [Microbacterium sp. MPKO10]MCW4457833.1 mannose-6-phosphate isomerase, class I [Microbacterium sp. MPKO10]
MFVAIENTPRPYAWGSHTAIAELQGREPSGEPEAELWLGAHPGSPSRIFPGSGVGFPDLAEWISADPASAGVASGRLPFLLKLLAAESPLSLQAHPSPEQAEAGYAREDAAGIPLDAPHRNYKDAFHKPELVVALSETYDALCGFRPVSEAITDIDALVAVATDAGQALAAAELTGLRERLDGDDADVLRDVIEYLLGSDVSALVSAVTDVAASAPLTPAVDTVRLLAEHYAGDPGIVVSLFINRVTLKRGEALYLPAGNIHAYLRGFGVELMAASDNVLRGGLTPKHVDVAELLTVLNFDPVPVPYLQPAWVSDGVDRFAVDVPDFELYRMEVQDTDATMDLEKAAIAVVTRGEAELTGGQGAATLTAGQAVYVTPDESALSATGDGEVFVATSRV